MKTREQKIDDAVHAAFGALGLDVEKQTNLAEMLNTELKTLFGDCVSDDASESSTKTFNHAYTIAFAVSGSKTEDGSDLTAEQFKPALLARIESICRNDNWKEALGAPYDTYEEE